MKTGKRKEKMKKNRTKINRKKKLMIYSPAIQVQWQYWLLIKKSILFSIIQFFSSHQTHKPGMHLVPKEKSLVSAVLYPFKSSALIYLHPFFKTFFACTPNIMKCPFMLFILPLKIWSTLLILDNVSEQIEMIYPSIKILFKSRKKLNFNLFNYIFSIDTFVYYNQTF